MRGADGETSLVYVNPHDGQVLGALWDGGAAGSPEMWTVRKLDSLALLGWGGERVIEAAAIDMVAPQIRGKGKIILDMTNPFLARPDGYGAGLPKDGPQSGIEVHHRACPPS